MWRSLTTGFHRVLVAVSALAFVGLVLEGRGRARRWQIVQTALFAAVVLGSYFGFAASTPTVWPLVIVACILPWLSLPGRPSARPALLMSVSLVATTVLTHAIFFGEDRYHMVATPVLCLLAAAALRGREARRPQASAVGRQAGDPT